MTLETQISSSLKIKNNKHSHSSSSKDLSTKLDINIYKATDESVKITSIVNSNPEKNIKNTFEEADKIYSNVYDIL